MVKMEQTINEIKEIVVQKVKKLTECTILKDIRYIQGEINAYNNMLKMLEQEKVEQND